MTKLTGKTAIVTGGSRDIGRAVSEKLAAEGANVVVNYCNNEADGHATLDAIKAAGGSAILVKADVTKEADVERLVAETLSNFGGKMANFSRSVHGVLAGQRQPMSL